MRISLAGARPHARAVRRVLTGAVLAGAVAAALAGCTIATPASSGSSTSSSAAVSSAAPLPAAPAGASLVVTVPGLAAPAASAASPGSSAGPSSSAPAPSVDTAPVSGKAPTSSAPAVVTPSTSSVAPTTAPAAPTTSTPAALATTSAATTTAATTAAPTPAAPTTSAPATLAVTLANCPGCTVLATHAGVTSTLGAALVATGQGRAALLSLRGDGSVAGAANVLYGSSFPTPSGGQLACDAGGRCIVIAQQADGTAIASAYQVNAAGVWAEVSGQGGIASVTAKAQTLTVGGGVGVAVQDQADGTTVWIVYEWAGDGYSVAGCTAAAVPDPNALSMTSCLS
ncbi:hypothetical protein ABIB25_004387 [Nakamurella sp. UYEF19]|uniref:hypothetical protein n=1 Tax=Nakamurella sp. UYEF19 TaxID=1756392 RepID=UPI003390C9B1